MQNPETFPERVILTNEEAKQRLDQLITDIATVRTKQDEIQATQTRIEQKTDEVKTRVDTIDTRTATIETQTRSRTP